MEIDLRMLEEGPQVNIHPDKPNATLKHITNGKTPGLGGIQRKNWFKEFTSIYERLTIEMNECIQKTKIPEWMTKGKTIQILNDSFKGTTPTNYRPITSLLIMRKILTAQIKEQIYNLLINRIIFPDEQKGCRKRSKDPEKLICIDQHILNESRGCPRGVMVKTMDCGIVVREFVLQSRYYVHFRANTLGKGMNPLILPAMG